MSHSLLNFSPISRTRRNHGLEHATLHVLSRRFPRLSLAGISSPRGFIILGDVTSEDVAEAAIEALKRLRAGESNLALHPNCGTNFAIPGAFAGLAGWLATLGSDKSFKSKLERLPLALALATVALSLTFPLGPIIQKRFTTSGDPQGLELERVETCIRAGIRVHHVTTRG
ncbi:MAG TPA: DUF6391 domain-containing protein [Brevefilum fermentans]|jgi:hypothetical protein|uniref:Uncharacterized protein n=1 Tax=Candidatus Brevifilum fermentans TaxID=1986204 RepID=A0A1Y6K305_9CHLR|nr:DUF6391 domain-containing protein [Brevefilum fermentans]MDI9567242.1 DUF6391 domain-containing protein [Chloroflexota bacterium]OQB84190.1 MAG: hypothetical protein BWX85_01035 [Chloroflexi bacterium ADurb.Bin120]SMX53248.1 conserved protein of unknown function [Brevefilum fermentans]HOM66898.1 DUF6391 domain-containing protein [Brevefilum fermentans]HPX95212.1 DUF6391 domain-containing protein [Brevefilum fermentans]